MPKTILQFIGTVQVGGGRALVVTLVASLVVRRYHVRTLDVCGEEAENVSVWVSLGLGGC